MKYLAPVLAFLMLSPFISASQTQEGNASYNSSKQGFAISHSSLSFNTRVKVTNLSNNRFEEAVVNARIPISTERIADISRDLGDALGMSRNGMTLVEIEILPPRTAAVTEGSPPPENPAPVPVVPPEPVPIQSPAPAPEPAPVPVVPPEPVPVQSPAPAPEPAPVPVVPPEPVPVQSPAPTPEPVPVPAPPPPERAVERVAAVPAPVPTPAPRSAEPVERIVERVVEVPVPVPAPAPEVRTEIQYVPVPAPSPERPACLPYLIPILCLLILIIILIIVVILLVARRPVFWPWYRPVRIRRRYRCGRWGRNFY